MKDGTATEVQIAESPDTWVPVTSAARHFGCSTDLIYKTAKKMLSAGNRGIRMHGSRYSINLRAMDCFMREEGRERAQRLSRPFASSLASVAELPSANDEFAIKMRNQKRA